MPTYQYVCTACGHAFEKYQSFSEDSLTVCPVCDGALRKVYNSVGIVFKGSGFYSTDSKSSPSSLQPSSEDKHDAKPAASEAASSSETSSSASSTSSSAGSAEASAA